MAGETHITLVGNLVANPELRYTPAGAAVANFRVASTPRKFNGSTGQWEEGEAMFLTCNVWKQYAEHVAATLAKGMNVIVQGRLRQRSYQTREGENRTVFEVEVDEVGPTLRYVQAQVFKPQQQGQQQPQQQGGFGQQAPQQQGQANDPWNAPAQGGFGQQQGGTWSQPAQTGGADEPPF